MTKTYIIEEKFTGYANIRIESETKEEALTLYNRGYYADSDYDMDDIFYDHHFVGITVCLLYTSPSPRDLSTSRMPSSA